MTRFSSQLEIIYLSQVAATRQSGCRTGNKLKIKEKEMILKSNLFLPQNKLLYTHATKNIKTNASPTATH